jgi:hypothetical protein
MRLAVPPADSDNGAWMNDASRLGSVRLAVQLAPFAGIAFLWFIGAMRHRIGTHEDRFFATVFLGSGLLFVASLFASAALTGAVAQAASVGGIHAGNSETYLLARRLIGMMTNVFGIRMAGVFIISTSTIVFRTGVLPRWIAFFGFSCAAILLLIITSWPWIALLFPIWMLVASAGILWVEFHAPQRAAAAIF